LDGIRGPDKLIEKNSRSASSRFRKGTTQRKGTTFFLDIHITPLFLLKKKKLSSLLNWIFLIKLMTGEEWKEANSNKTNNRLKHS